jgi:hypothetical protein
VKDIVVPNLFHHILALTSERAVPSSTIAALQCTTSRSELYSHADTCVVGSNALIVYDYKRPVNVTGFDPSKGSIKNLNIVSAALAYDDPATGRTLILILNQAIHIPTIDHNLINPIQLQLNDIKCDLCPKFLATSPTDTTHSLSIPDDGETDYVIPLQLKGVTSYFPTRKPTQAEYDGCQQLELTYHTPEWNPHVASYEQQEDALLDPTGRLRESGASTGQSTRSYISAIQSKASLNAAIRIASMVLQTSAVLQEIDPNLIPDEFAKNLNATVRVASINLTERKKGLEAQELARNWGCGLAAAERTLLATTQKRIRTIRHPSLARRLTMNDRHLRYKCLYGTICVDNLEATIKSKRQHWRMKHSDAVPYLSSCPEIRHFFTVRAVSE